MTPHETTDDPRVALAVERTVLAWIRTGIAMMGFGFVVARFSLFLRELAASSQSSTPLRSTPGASLWIGIALLALGAFVEVSASWRYYRNVKRVRRGVPPVVLDSAIGTVVGGLLAVLAAITVAYLIWLAVDLQ